MIPHKSLSDPLLFFFRYPPLPSKFTEEKFGQAEKTELDAHLENLLIRAEATKHWTEKIMKQTEVLLQPNPSTTMLLLFFLFFSSSFFLLSRLTNETLT